MKKKDTDWKKQFIVRLCIIATLCLVSSIIGHLQFSFGFLAAVIINWIEES